MTHFIVARARRLMLGAALALITPGTALADAVYLKNGDRISGTVEHLDDEYLEITLPYADDATIKIEVSEIVSIETDEEVDIMLEDGTLSKARLERAPEGGMVVVLRKSLDSP